MCLQCFSQVTPLVKNGDTDEIAAKIEDKVWTLAETAFAGKPYPRYNMLTEMWFGNKAFAVAKKKLAPIGKAIVATEKWLVSECAGRSAPIHQTVNTIVKLCTPIETEDDIEPPPCPDLHTSLCGVIGGPLMVWVISALTGISDEIKMGTVSIRGDSFTLEVPPKYDLDTLVTAANKAATEFASTFGSFTVDPRTLRVGAHVHDNLEHSEAFTYVWHSRARALPLFLTCCCLQVRGGGGGIFGQRS